jgi:hypothetical protein
LWWVVVREVVGVVVAAQLVVRVVASVLLSSVGVDGVVVVFGV